MNRKKMDWPEVCRRYRKIYTGAVADILDGKGIRNHSLPPFLRPLKETMGVAGPAFTCQGFPVADTASDDTPMLIKMLEALPPHSVVVLSAGGDQSSSHWGEMMTLSALQRGCTGAVVDGSVRDSSFIIRMNFPVFTRFRIPASSVGRWQIKEFQSVIRVGATVIHPGDFVFGDLDGVVVVPEGLAEEVLRDAEQTIRKEQKMRQALRGGSALIEVYKHYGSF